MSQGRRLLVACRGIPHLKIETPDFLHVARGNRCVCGFCEESRMKFAEPIGPDGKFGDVEHPSFVTP
jgi:hypothetical protein